MTRESSNEVLIDVIDEYGMCVFSLVVVYKPLLVGQNSNTYNG